MGPAAARRLLCHHPQVRAEESGGSFIVLVHFEAYYDKSSHLSILKLISVHFQPSFRDLNTLETA